MAPILDERPTMFALIFDKQNLALLKRNLVAETEELHYFVIAQKNLATQDYQRDVT